MSTLSVTEMTAGEGNRVQTEAGQQHRIRTWLLNPFHYVAGGRALGWGIAVILLSGFLGSLSDSHFDGVLDFHSGIPAPLWFFLVLGMVDWAVMAALLAPAGMLMSKSRVRVLDVMGRHRPWFTWTKGLVFHSGDKTASRYDIREMEGGTYMFFEWKSGDYTIRHRKPKYYVLRKAD